MSRQMTVGGYRPGWLSWGATALFLGAGLLRLFAPFLWVAAAPDAASMQREAPFIGALSIVLVAVLAVAIWVDANRDTWCVGVALGLVVLNIVVRSSLNISLGAEFNFVLPLVAGLAVGGPFGTLVGAASCLGSQFLTQQVATQLPAQMVVWGLAGLLGGLLRPLGPRLSWAVSPFAGYAFGIGAGFLLNAISWPADPSALPAYIPVAPLDANLTALWQYGQATSWGVDRLRGLATALGLAVIGLPLAHALRTTIRPAPTERTHAPIDDPATSVVVANQERATRIHQIWETEP